MFAEFDCFEPHGGATHPIFKPVKGRNVDFNMQILNYWLRQRHNEFAYYMTWGLNVMT